MSATSSLPPWLEPTLRRGLTMPAHALLLHGPGPLGQFELGMALAHARLCETRAAGGLACGRCASCHLFERRSHPDFMLLIPDALRERLGWQESDESESKAASKAKPSRDVKVDAVRAAIEWAQRTSSRNAGKVLLIHPTEAMNETAANALLKTLEEPPGQLLLLLAANDPESLLPTVRSRCQRLAIAMPSQDQALSWLAEQGTPESAVLLAAAGGLPHVALAMHEDGVDATQWNRLPADVRAGRVGNLSGWPVARVVEALHKLCHDLMRVGAGGEPRFFSADALASTQRPALPSMTVLVAWQRELVRAARHDEHPWNAPLRAEALVAQAAALWQTPRPAPSGGGPPLATLPAP